MLDSVLLFLTNIVHVTNVGLTENPTFLKWLMLDSLRINIPDVTNVALMENPTLITWPR